MAQTYTVSNRQNRAELFVFFHDIIMIMKYLNNSSYY